MEHDRIELRAWELYKPYVQMLSKLKHGTKDYNTQVNKNMEHGA